MSWVEPYSPPKTPTLYSIHLLQEELWKVRQKPQGRREKVRIAVLTEELARLWEVRRREIVISRGRIVGR